MLLKKKKKKETLKIVQLFFSTTFFCISYIDACLEEGKESDDRVML